MSASLTVSSQFWRAARPGPGYSDTHLEHAAAVSLVEDQLLLEQRVEGAPRRARLRLGQALLAADQVDLHPGRGQHLGAGLALGEGGVRYWDYTRVVLEKVPSEDS